MSTTEPTLDPDQAPRLAEAAKRIGLPADELLARWIDRRCEPSKKPIEEIGERIVRKNAKRYRRLS